MTTSWPVGASSIPQVLAARAAEQPDTAFLRGDQELTFAQLADESTIFAAALRAVGVEPGDRVAVACENGPDWLVAFFGVLRAGGIVVTINPLYRDAELTHMLSTTRARAVISEPATGDYDLVDYYRKAELPHLEMVVFRTGRVEIGGAKRRLTTLGEFMRPSGPASAPDGSSELSCPAPNDPAVVLFSSGTTGRAKGAVLTHDSLLASANAEVAHFNLTSDDVMVGVMPLNHVGGITCTVLSMLLAGGAIEMIPRFHPTKVVDLLVAGRITAMVGVPTMYIMALQDPRLTNPTAAGLARVRLCVVGGANLEPAVARAVATAFPGVRVANLYGLSETSGACIISPPDVDADELAHSIGVAIGDFRLSVVRQDGAVAAPGESGELRVAGACLMNGYWELSEETHRAITTDGWLNTGDIATIDERGRVTLLGRSKEMFVRGGYNVYPAEVEGVISQLPGVAMVAVVGRADKKYGSAGRAVVVRSADSELTGEAVRAHCAAHLAEYKVPDDVVFAESLPLTPSGKIRKTELAD